MMLRWSHAILHLVLATFTFSIVGEGLVVLCLDEQDDHVAYELAANKHCTPNPQVEQCPTVEPHIDNPNNHPVDFDPCMDLTVELASFNFQRDDQQSTLLADQANSVIATPHATDTFSDRVVPLLILDHTNTQRVTLLSATVLLL
jgi:hypothetical protein